MQPKDIVWNFGSGRTGSTWLSGMMRDLEGWTSWGEPLVGKLFGDMWRWDGAEQRAENVHYVLPRERPDLWREAVRSFVLTSVEVRFPEAERLWVGEPNGSAGAKVLLSAFPESSFVFLLRDPRDIVASFLDGARSWWDKGGKRTRLATSDPDRFVERQARWVRRSLEDAWKAYAQHRGPKVKVRYEDLRNDAFGEMTRLLFGLGISVDEPELRSIVEKHSWDNPKSLHKKGPGTKRRKAQPGAWREDLTPAQIKTVEEFCQPILHEFYR